MAPKDARGTASCTLPTGAKSLSKTLTGRRLAPALFLQRPSRYSFRHLKTRLGFNAYCCATCGTDTPGFNVSRTILCFSSIVQRRCLLPCLEVSTSRLVDTNKVSTKAIISTLPYLVETVFERRLLFTSLA